MTNGILPRQQPQAASEVWAIFAGVIDQGAVSRFFNGFTAASANQVGHLHLLFQSTGGTVADGVCLYNFLHTLPVEISLYNVGTVASAGALVYLGAKNRKASTTATFMLHRTQAAPLGATAERLQALGKSVMLDDQRTEAILRAHLKLPDDLWDVHRVADLWLSAEEAVKYGLATEIADFAPQKGMQLFSL
jgi:ATP-dependent Clp protease protease subunit